MDKGQKIFIDFSADDDIKEEFMDALMDKYHDIEWEYFEGGIKAYEKVNHLYHHGGGGLPPYYEEVYDIRQEELEEFICKFIADNSLTDEEFYYEGLLLFEDWW